MFQVIDYTYGFDIWRQCDFGALVFIKWIFVHKALANMCITNSCCDSSSYVQM